MNYDNIHDRYSEKDSDDVAYDLEVLHHLLRDVLFEDAIMVPHHSNQCMLLFRAWLTLKVISISLNTFTFI
jgi:hypothetical protein